LNLREVRGGLDLPLIPTMPPGAKQRNVGTEQREKVITRGGSPPPKLEQQENLFHDARNQRVPHSNRTASDDLAFTTGKRTDGIVTNNARHPIPIHPNPFDALSNTNLLYPDFIPGTDTEDDERQDVPFSPAPPKTPKRTHEQRTRRRSRKTVDSDKNEYISDEERDLSMYRLSDEDSDSSLMVTLAECICSTTVPCSTRFVFCAK
jgi:hypothetical protein